MEQAINDVYTDSTHEQIAADIPANEVAAIKHLLVTQSAKTVDNEKSKKNLKK